MGGRAGHKLLHLILSSRTWVKLKTSTPVILGSSYHYYYYIIIHACSMRDKRLLALNTCAKWENVDYCG